MPPFFVPKSFIITRSWYEDCPYLDRMHRLLVIIFMLPFAVLAQNLVPNPGFEEHNGDVVSTWEQPPEPFYHFEDSEMGEPMEGSHYNGLCLYNHDVCEYLTVKLKEPLSAGQEYCMALGIRLADFKAIRFTLSDGVGVLLTEKKPDVHTKTYLFETPQVELNFAPMDDRFGWTRLECGFTAEGGERYLTLGHFFDREELEAEDPRLTEVKIEMRALQKDKDIALTDAYAVIDQKYPPIKIDYSDPLREYTKKEMRQFEKERENVQYRISEKKSETARINQEFEVKLKALEEKYNDVPLPYFSIRYYFDDVSLKPVFAGDYCACDEPLTLEEGQTFRLRDILFETGKWDLQSESLPELNRLADFLSSQPGITIKVNGHTDNVGSDADNKVLSENRAKSVATYLQGKGISSTRVQFEGFGASKAVADNKTDEGRTLNRRVEVEILEIAQD